MKTIKSLILAVMLFLSLGNVYAEEDCTYDQKAQQEYYQSLCNKHKNCKYLKSENKVIIERGPEKIEIRRGGCYDFGVSVTLTSSIANEYKKREAVLQKALNLADEFWHDSVNGNDLRKLIKEKKYQFQKTGSGYQYLFSHEYAIELMIEYSFKNGAHTITISYYTNV